MKNLDNYYCEGQLNLLDYLEEIKLPLCCENCIFLKDYKCDLEKGSCEKGSRSLASSDGWQRIKTNPDNTVSGKFPENMIWQPILTLNFNDAENRFFFAKGEGKDKTFKWPKGTDTVDHVLAWRYN